MRKTKIFKAALCLAICGLLFACKTPKSQKESAELSPEQVQKGIAQEARCTINAKILQIEELSSDRFQAFVSVTVVDETSCVSVGDSLLLLPNFLHTEGNQINMESLENQKMQALKKVQPGKIIKASIYLRQKNYAFVMQWEVL